MVIQMCDKIEKGRSVFHYAMFAWLGACLLAGVASAAEGSLSERYAMVVDPAAKQRLGAKTYDEVMEFFHGAEMAIETKDLRGLMALYSDDYSNGNHNKKSIEQIWARIFSTFETLATHHSMKLTNITATKREAASNTVVFNCSGVLLGEHDPEKGVLVIDSWISQDHVLVREAGKWRLIGSYGKDRARLWFDKPMHPLF